MREAGTAVTTDRRLAERVAVMLRIGTVVSAMLLAAGAVAGYERAGPAATILLAGGCGVLLLLPVIRLAMMAGHFARLADRRFVAVTLTVLLLVLAGAVTGLVH